MPIVLRNNAFCSKEQCFNTCLLFSRSIPIVFLNMPLFPKKPIVFKVIAYCFHANNYAYCFEKGWLFLSQCLLFKKHAYCFEKNGQLFSRSKPIVLFNMHFFKTPIVLKLKDNAHCLREWAYCIEKMPFVL